MKIRIFFCIILSFYVTQRSYVFCKVLAQKNNSFLGAGLLVLAASGKVLKALVDKDTPFFRLNKLLPQNFR